MRIDRRMFLAQAGLLSAVGFIRQAEAQQRAGRPFIAVYPKYPGHKFFRINEPGSYVLDQDQIQRQLWGAGHTGPSGVMLNILCGSVDVDFNGHTLGADYGVAGVALAACCEAGNEKKFLDLYGPASLDSRFVSLHNGTIDLARGDHTFSGVVFTKRWHDPDGQTGQRGTPSCGRYGGCPPEGIHYDRNDYRFEKLKVLTLCSALAVEGSHTVIRDCVIESAGTAAIFIAGPNVTIENCEIRLRKLAKGPFSFNQPTRAAIVLHDASNAVIRNNRIRVDYGGEPSDTYCILVHDGATNVVVQGNTFINVEGEPVTLSAGGEVAITDNKSERGWLPF